MAKTVYEELNESILKEYASLSRLEYGECPVSDIEHLRWKYLESPFGISYGLNLYDGDQLVGRISYQSRDYFIHGKRCRAGNLTDLLVHPQHRRLALFLEIARRPFGEDGLPNLDFSLMLPNKVSQPLYTGLLRLKAVGSVPVFTVPIRFENIARSALGISGGVLSRVASSFYRLFSDRAGFGRLTFSIESPTRERYAEMVEKWSLDRSIVGDRSWLWHRWRFFGDSRRSYDVVYHFLDGRLMGYTAACLRETEGLKSYFVIDVVTLLGDRKLLRELLYRVVDDARRCDADLVLGIYTTHSSEIRSFSGLPMVAVPRRFLPVDVSLFVFNYGLNGSYGTALSEMDNWHLSLADFDMF